MAIDHAGDQDLALAVKQIVDLAGPLVTAVQDLHDPAIVAHQEAGEAFDPASGVDRQAIDIVDEGVGEGWSGDKHQS